MTKQKTNLLLSILSAFVLFLVNFTQIGFIFHLLLPKIENLHYQNTEMGEQFKLSFLISLVIGLLPILLHLTWRLTSIATLKSKTISGLIVIAMMTLAVIFRQQLIKSTFDGLTNLKKPSGETIYNAFPIENLNFEYYLLGGLILGCVMTYFMFKGK
jgi:hypothetical protein